MATWGRRQSYPAVLGTTLVLSAVFAMTAVFKPLIPDPDPNPIVAVRGSYMKGAAKQLVKWRSLGEQPFAEAKRLDRPLVLIVGSSWNTTARIFDRDVLSDVDVAERLNREFVPVRIDSSVRPEWEFGPLPLLAASLGVEPGWYAVAIDPSGKLLSWLARADSQQILDTPTFQNWIGSVINLRVSKSNPQLAELTKQASLENQFLLGPTLPYNSNVATYLNGVSESASSSLPFQVNGISGWYPEDWRLLIQAGNVETARKGLRRALQTPLVDWLHGGLFRSDGLPGNGGTRFEKLYVQNAEMACVFAEIYAYTKDEIFKLAAEQTFDFVVRRVLQSETSNSFEYGDAGDLGRYPGISIRPSLLRRRFNGDDQAWLARHLSLDPAKNTAMIPAVSDLDDYLSHKDLYQDFLGRIVKILPPYRPKFGGDDLANDLGTICARLIEASRLLDDSGRLKKVAPLLNRLRQYQIGGDSVAQSLEPSATAIAFLGDYLGFADAMFQSYLATGNVADFENCVRVLNRAKSLFIDVKSGTARSTPIERTTPEAIWASFPNPIDGSQCSLVGTAIRLYQSASTASFGTKTSNEFRRTAESLAAKNLPLTLKVSLRLGGLVRAANLVSQNFGILVVGADSLELASDLAQKYPYALIFADNVGVLGGKAPAKTGIYLIRNGKATGPVTRAEVDALLRPSS